MSPLHLDGGTAVRVSGVMTGLISMVIVRVISSVHLPVRFET